MKVILTKKQDIVSSKTKSAYVKCDWLNPKTGAVGEIFCSKEQFESYGLPEDRIATKEDLKTFEDASLITEIEFDNTGRLVTVS